MFQGIHVQILNVVADYRFVCVVSDDMDTFEDMNVRMGMCAHWVGVWGRQSAFSVVPPTQAPEYFI